MKPSPLRRIPSVNRILQEIHCTDLPRASAREIVRRVLAGFRSRRAVPEWDRLLADIRAALGDVSASRLRPVINGTGILIHTNFGRAPLGPRMIETIAQIACSYSNLEYDLIKGERGRRAAYLEHLLAMLCGAQAATVVNNNAAALVLIVSHYCGDRQAHRSATLFAGRRSAKTEVLVSRGELIQIGGGFRIPEIVESSGAILREVGTTNRTTIEDYRRAASKQTALILKVHRSNFFMEGFVDSPDTAELALLAHQRRIPFVADIGSGAMMGTEAIPGLEHEPTPGEALRAGADLVCFSGDKLMGGPQSGIIAGKARMVSALKREPLFRALRCDKLVLAALQATAESYLRSGSAPAAREMGDAAGEEDPIPLLQMLRASQETLRARAGKVIAQIAGLPLAARVGLGYAKLGGGALPRSRIQSTVLELEHKRYGADILAARLRRHNSCVASYIRHGKVVIDLRTVFPWQDKELVDAIRAAAS